MPGGSGFIAGHIIEKFLESGFHVRALVRDVSDYSKHFHLKTLKNASPETFSVAKIDLEESDFSKSFDGANIVIHTASPFFKKFNNPENDIVFPAVNGARVAFQSALKVGAKRFVLTSDARTFQHRAPHGYKYTSLDWNDDYDESGFLTSDPYVYSKIMAEKAVWDLAKENSQIELAVVAPVFVLGPAQSTFNISTSIKNFISLISLSPSDGAVGIVDVRDVAAAHYIAATSPEAVGKRFPVWTKTLEWKELRHLIFTNFPQYFNDYHEPIMNKSTSGDGEFTFDTSELERLGWKSNRTADQIVIDTVNGLIDQQILME